jgi:hypothetical protein
VNTLLDDLRLKIARVMQQPWEHTQPISIKLHPATAMRSDGILTAGLRYLVQGRDGTWVEVHADPLVALADEAAIDDLLAHGLSIFLMKHPGWPA